MFNSPNISLRRLVGNECGYIDSVAKAASLTGLDPEAVDKAVDFFPEEDQKLQDELALRTGMAFNTPVTGTIVGSPTESFRKAAHSSMAPAGGFASSRIGEDGRLYLIGKSEHYHASLGHNFNGYKLVEYAHNAGIPNASHNNTRGYITRLLENELVKAADCPKLDRVINLETGSLAVEAGVKMMLARFYRLEPQFEAPLYSGKTPVFFVLNGSYHGTTILTQTFRGMWGEMYSKMEEAGIIKVVSLTPNDINEFAEAVKTYNSGSYKTAGFMHEIIMMNFGAVRLTREYLHEAYRLCHSTDTPVLVDEIQTCMWYPGMFLFRLYELDPDFAVIGKGFPGGEYPASKIITTAAMDNLNQFGALVTNGQEELASTAYLVTMEFAKANKDNIQQLGTYFYDRLSDIAKRNPMLITRVEGLGHCAALHFENVEKAAAFSKAMNMKCIDCSVQLYKASCPPAALFKPPLIASQTVLDFICDNVQDVIRTL